MVWETSSGNICVTRRGSAIDNLKSDVNNQSKAIPDNSRKFLIFFSNRENRNFQASRNTAAHDAKTSERRDRVYEIDLDKSLGQYFRKKQIMFEEIHRDIFGMPLP